MQAREHITILVLGDSLSAGYGLSTSSAWPSLLQQELKTKDADYTVANASISGETSAGGLARLPALLKKEKPQVLILELGANDGLRGLPLANLASNLRNMIDLAKQEKVKVLLLGMKLPPNYGNYAKEFALIYQQLAKKTNIAFIPFFLEQIAEKPELFQADGLHPTAAAQSKILNTILPKLQPLL